MGTPPDRHRKGTPAGGQFAERTKPASTQPDRTLTLTNKNPDDPVGDLYDKMTYDEDGYDAHGYNRDGFNKDGYHRNGTPFNPEGFNKTGFDADGVHRNGTSYDDTGYDRHGFGPDGFDRSDVHWLTDLTRDGINVDWVNRPEPTFLNFGTGHDIPGFRFDERFSYKDDRFDRRGFDDDGFNRYGYDEQGFDRDGYTINQTDRWGRTRDTYKPPFGVLLRAVREATSPRKSRNIRRKSEHIWGPRQPPAGLLAVEPDKER